MRQDFRHTERAHCSVDAKGKTLVSCADHLKKVRCFLLFLVCLKMPFVTTSYVYAVDLVKDRRLGAESICHMFCDCIKKGPKLFVYLILYI